jgi:hypothetical protein
MATELKVSNLKRGDIVFFATRNATDLSVFAQLAAYVQGWPYADPKPWYHVAVATGPGSIIDFATDSANALPWATHLKSRQITDDADATVNALRLNDAVKAEELARAAELMEGKAYTEPGLLAFAASSQARMFRAGAARDTLFNFAAGFEKLAADPAAGIDAGHTCVTGVTAAIAHAGVLPNLVVKEPDPLAGPNDSQLESSIVNLYACLKPGQSLPDVVNATKPAAVSTATGPRLLSLDQVNHGYSGDMAPMAPGAAVKYTHEYVNALADTILDLQKKWTLPEVVHAGEAVRAAAWPTPASWTVSPAMLYDGLVSAGAQPA